MQGGKLTYIGGILLYKKRTTPREVVNFVEEGGRVHWVRYLDLIPSYVGEASSKIAVSQYELPP